MWGSVERGPFHNSSGCRRSGTKTMMTSAESCSKKPLERWMRKTSSVSTLIQKPPKLFESCILHYMILLCMKRDLKLGIQCCQLQLSCSFFFLCVEICQTERKSYTSDSEREIYQGASLRKELTSALWTLWSFFPMFLPTHFFFVWLPSANDPLPVSPHRGYCKKQQLSFV